MKPAPDQTLLIVLACAAMRCAQAAEPLPDLPGAEELGGHPISWCELRMAQGEPRAFAVLASSPPGGQYVVVERGRRVARLAGFQGAGELSCYTPRQARALNRTIAASETVRGAIRPRWNGTVVCGFTSDTEAVCWQYAPAQRRYVEMGRWST